MTGGSHAGALKAGWTLLGERRLVPSDVTLDFAPLGLNVHGSGKFFERQGDRVVITKESFRRRLPVLSPSDTPCDAVAFSSPFYSRTLWSKPYWRDLRLASQSAPDAEQRAPVSDGLLRHCIAQHNADQLDFLHQLQQIGLTVLAIDSPRPFRHNPQLRRAGLETVKHIENEYRQHTRAMLDRHQIGCVMAPAETCDADGLCPEKFRHDDPADVQHANAAFGALLCQEIVRVARERLASDRTAVSN